MERQALKKESDEASKKRLGLVEEELAEVRERASGMKAQWMAERDRIGELRAVKERLEQLRLGYEQATRRGDLERASELRFSQIPSTEREASELQTKIDEAQSGSSFSERGGER